jgi:hypothetical protein
LIVMHICDEKLPYSGSNAYCKVCGMDLGFRAVKKKRGRKTFYYCCEECADAEKDS